MYNLTIQ